MQRGAFLRELLDRLLVGAVGREPELAAQHVIVVVGGERGGKRAAATTEAGGLEICVVERGAADADLDGDGAVAALAAAERGAELRGDALAADVDGAIRNEVRLLQVFQLELIHRAGQFVAQGAHDGVLRIDGARERWEGKQREHEA